MHCLKWQTRTCVFLEIPVFSSSSLLVLSMAWATMQHLSAMESKRSVLSLGVLHSSYLQSSQIQLNTSHHALKEKIPHYQPYSNQWLDFPPKIKGVVFNLQHCILQHMEIWKENEFKKYRKENVIRILFRSRLPLKNNFIFTHDTAYVSKLHFSKFVFATNIHWC